MEAEHSLIMFPDWSQAVPFAKLNSIKDRKCMLCRALAPKEDRQIQVHNSFPVPTGQLVSSLAKCLNISNCLHVSLLCYSHIGSHTNASLRLLHLMDSFKEFIYCNPTKALWTFRWGHHYNKTPSKQAPWRHALPQRTRSSQPQIQAMISQARKWTNRTRWRE